MPPIFKMKFVYAQNTSAALWKKAALPLEDEEEGAVCLPKHYLRTWLWIVAQLDPGYSAARGGFFGWFRRYASNLNELRAFRHHFICLYFAVKHNEALEGQ